MQVTKEPYGRTRKDCITVVYTIGDFASFIEFIMVLRRVFANKSDDLLDDHDLLNLSSTREHPVLPKIVARVPNKWIHVKLQVKDKDNDEGSKMPGKNEDNEDTLGETKDDEDTMMQEVDDDNEDTKTWVTLIMRDDNLYVLGFKNHNGVYGLKDDHENGEGMLSKDEAYNPEMLRWTVRYKSILGAASDDVALETLSGAHVGYKSAIKFVRNLSAFTNRDPPNVVNEARKALACLIILVCESARLNPVLDAIAAEWETGNGFTAELMNNYVWQGCYGTMSKKLLEWRSRNYCRTGEALHPIKQLQAVYLVLRTPTTDEDASKKKNTKDKEDMPIDGTSYT